MTHSVRFVIPAAACLMLLATAAPARADVTWFLGTTRRPAPLLVPANTSTKSTMAGTTGLAGGLSLIVVGFEVEGSSTFENAAKQGVSVREVRVMAALVMLTVFVVLGSLAMMVRGLGVMFGRGLVMVMMRLAAHGNLPCKRLRGSQGFPATLTER